MSETVVRVGVSGRLVLPADLRRESGIAVGDDVVLIARAGVIEILSRAESVRRARALIRRFVAPDRSLADELLEERRSERENG